MFRFQTQTARDASGAGIRRPEGDAETALLPARFWCTTHVESAHFDWRWRERPALALLAWEALVAIR